MDLSGPTRVMGILNLTPDSFSDGARFADANGGVGAAVDAGLAMAEAGADFIDIGGESTRPGASAVDAEEEANRVVPVIEGLRRQTDAKISIDTMKASVALRAMEAGADLVNDVSALGDPEMVGVLERTGAPVVVMHMRGTPRTMQEETGYDDVVAEVADFLKRKAAWAASRGIAGDKIVLDPGIGFGKSLEGNLKLLLGLPVLLRGGWPVLVGASRKSFLGTLLDLPVDSRLEGSLAVAAAAAAAGTHILRVHDVRETARVIKIIDALRDART